jgi:hypothetical protein
MQEHKCPEGTNHPYEAIVRQYRRYPLICWGVFSYRSAKEPKMDCLTNCPYCGQKLEPAETRIKPVRPVKVGETFVVEGGRAYVGDDEVTIPQLSYVVLDGGKGADGQWEANINDFFFDRGMVPRRSGERPRNHVMMSAGILVDVEEQHIPVKVAQVYTPPVPKDCVVRCVEHFQHIPAAQVNDDTVVTVSCNDLTEFGKSLSFAFGKPIDIRRGMTVAQLVHHIEHAA